MPPRRNKREDSRISKILTFELPLPPNTLSMNARPHWAAKAKAKAKFRSDCANIFRSTFVLRRRFAEKVVISYEVFQGKHPAFPKDGLLRVRDERNLGEAFKIIEDSLVDANIIKDDSRQYVTLGKITLHSVKESKSRMAIIMTVSSCEGKE